MTWRAAAGARAVAVLAAWVALASAARASESSSVNNCQNAAKTQAVNFLKNKLAAVDTCLQAISKQIIQNNAPNAAGAAVTCVKQFRLINDSRATGRTLLEKLATGITKSCTPNPPLTLGDILGPGATASVQPIDADNLALWCAHFGGTGTITSLNDWISCIETSQDCALAVAVSTQYPRALEWLGLVQSAMLALTPPANDPTQISDAMAALDAVHASIAGPGGGAAPNLQCGRVRLLATGQTASSTAGDDGAVQAGVALRYRDNGDGTVTDLNTGLMWEKKVKLDNVVDAANLHDADDCYPWSGTCHTGGAVCAVDADCGANGPCEAGDCQTTAPNGKTIFQWLAALNAASFAGYNDWRVPNVRELHGLVDYAYINPSVAPALHGTRCGAACTDLTDPTCSCNRPDLYWSSTTVATFPGDAWDVYFRVGDSGNFFKTGKESVRAVRGGL